MTFPLRYQLAAALVGLNIISTAALAGFAYRASRQSLEAQAARAVGVVAEARDAELVQMLARRRQRMDAFLASVESLCGERASKDTFAWESECVRVALSGFQASERAEAADLQYRGRRIAARGTWLESSPPASSGALAAISGNAGQGDYTMTAARGNLSLVVRFPLDDIDAIFQDRSGLEANGEVFLVDHEGRLLTRARYAVDPGRRALDASQQPCLAGSVGQTLGSDYHGARVMSGFRPVPSVGGGCVVANLQYADALIPIHRLGQWFTFASIGFIVAGGAVSLLVARAVREHEARLAAEAANRTKDDFLAMVSHELRTPLNAILGWASILRNHQSDGPTVDRALQAVERSARTQARLIDELLDVSSIVRGQLQLGVASEVPLTAIVEGAVEAIRPVADARRVEMTLRLTGAPPCVFGDADRLQQVAGNLLSNAVRFSHEGGGIDIALATVDDAAELRVADHGVGISPEFLPHVFDRFRQADSSTTRAHGGLGLGLAIVRHLVELHGGTVRAESAGPGTGAAFIVRLPLSTAAASLPHESRPEPSVPPLLEGTRVLIVDDDPETRDVLRAILEDAGASVSAIGSAAETRAFLAHAEADLLIADIGMPKEDGYSLIRSLRALESVETSHMPAIALTAHARPEDVEHALASGFQMHLAKPIDSSRLLSAVATTLIRTWTH